MWAGGAADGFEENVKSILYPGLPPGSGRRAGSAWRLRGRGSSVPFPVDRGTLRFPGIPGLSPPVSGNAFRAPSGWPAVSEILEAP